MATDKLWVPDRREIIWIDCNPQVGKEMKDVHPLLVLSSKAFNEKTGNVIGLPMTTAESNETNPFAVKFKSAKGVASYILSHQPKSFDWKQRDAKSHPLKEAPIEAFNSACEALNQIIAICD
jgi:mRNA interferase MazF